MTFFHLFKGNVWKISCNGKSGGHPMDVLPIVLF